MRIALSKFAGLASGGVEKYLQSIAVILKDAGHDIDYYYTNAAPIHGTSWVHPPNDADRKQEMIDYGINLVKVHVGYRVHNTWYESDFFSWFFEDRYDCLIIAGNGEPEFPYTRLKNIKIIHTVHGEHPFDQPNLKKSILICKWQADRWLANGGNLSKLEIIPPVVKIPETYPTDFRQNHNIPKDAFVFGMHQRDDPSIFSSISLEAFSQLKLDNTYMVIMGGSDRHKNFVEQMPPEEKAKVIFVDFCSNPLEIHNFLQSIDVYAHSRLDGEVCSASIIEAMFHGKPVVSCPGRNNGHQEQIQNCGFFCYNVGDYVSALKNLATKSEVYKNSSNQTKQKYKDCYSFDSVREKIINAVNEIIIEERL